MKKIQKNKTKKSEQILVIALGGNALIKHGQKGTAEEQIQNVDLACKHIAKLIKKGHRVVITHGNGPQVGNILIQQENAEDFVPKMPLDVCGAQSQGQIGYFIQQTLQRELHILKANTKVVTLVTRVLVDRNDPAFKNPTKPIGPFLSEEKAKKISHELGCKVINDANRGWRRVVPSPDPKEIIELPEIMRLLATGCIVICCGGGGIPVIKKDEDGLKGIEAVIDKDLAAELLASKIGADKLIILTDVKKVALNYKKFNQENLDQITVTEATRYLCEGQFAHGSMGPKIEAGIRFAKSRKDRVAIIASLEDLEKAIENKEGTRIVQ